MKEQITALALKLVGCPYIWGGANPWTGFDCSGFVIWVYQVFGILPSGDWTADGLRRTFEQREGGAHAAPNDSTLHFYGSPDHASHVMLGIPGGVYAVGASGGDHTTTTIEEARRRGAQVKVKPIRYRSDYQTSVSVWVERV